MKHQNSKQSKSITENFNMEAIIQQVLEVEQKWNFVESNCEVSKDEADKLMYAIVTLKKTVDDLEVVSHCEVSKDGADKLISAILTLKKILDDVEDRKREDEEESEVIFLREVFAEEAYLSYCTGCEICATLNKKEKFFLTKLCKAKKL